MILFYNIEKGNIKKIGKIQRMLLNQFVYFNISIYKITNYGNYDLLFSKLNLLGIFLM
jgi:hypothetical protein